MSYVGRSCKKWIWYGLRRDRLSLKLMAVRLRASLTRHGVRFAVLWIIITSLKGKPKRKKVSFSKTVNGVTTDYPRV